MNVDVEGLSWQERAGKLGRGSVCVGEVRLVSRCGGGRGPPPRPRPGKAGNGKEASVWESRAEAVRQAFLHAYRGYKEHAYGHDELLPLTNGSVDKCVALTFLVAVHIS